MSYSQSQSFQALPRSLSYTLLNGFKKDFIPFIYITQRILQVFFLFINEKQKIFCQVYVYSKLSLAKITTISKGTLFFETVSLIFFLLFWFLIFIIKKLNLIYFNKKSEKIVYKCWNHSLTIIGENKWSRITIGNLSADGVSGGRFVPAVGPTALLLSSRGRVTLALSRPTSPAIPPPAAANYTAPEYHPQRAHKYTDADVEKVYPLFFSLG